MESHNFKMNESLVKTASSAISRGSADDPVTLYIESLPSLQSRRTMTQALARITDILAESEPAKDQAENEQRARDFRWQDLTPAHVEVIKARVGEKVSKSTANKMLAALRGVLAKARLLRLISSEDFADVKAIKGFKARTELRGRALKEDELMALALACRADKTAAGVRDAALMAVAYGAGLRRFEIAALSVADWDPSEQSLKIKHGKGDKTRTVYLSDSSRRCLDKWLALRPEAGPASPLFCPVNKGGRIVEKRMTDQAIYNMLEKRRLQAGIKAFSPHDMRRSFISDLLDSGADISAVAGLAGHSSVTTTQKYDRRGERAKRAAALKLKSPF
jgi:site-specific recombinase XerD